jgi:hypothetical protein
MLYNFIYKAVKYLIIFGVVTVVIYKVFTEPRLPAESYWILPVTVIMIFMTMKK